MISLRCRLQIKSNCGLLEAAPSTPPTIYFFSKSIISGKVASSAWLVAIPLFSRTTTSWFKWNPNSPFKGQWNLIRCSSINLPPIMFLFLRKLSKKTSQSKTAVLMMTHTRSPLKNRMMIARVKDQVVAVRSTLFPRTSNRKVNFWMV